jgi:hypothetical protein
MTIANTTRMPMVVMFLLIQSTGRLSRMARENQNRTVANLPTMPNPTCR